ncbi:hypothetical protein AMECASPLE_020691 [Ameca splendens]|uniref:Uncharacterized protein n=1 Tax=Ameca splendens TaxID=208324 RepID=A0ABV0XGC4_9TELE
MLVSFLDLDVLEMSSGIHQKACILRYLFHDCIKLVWQDHPGNISGLTSTYGSLAATVVAIWKQWEFVHCIPTLFWLQPKGFCQAAKTDKPHPLVIPRSLAHRRFRSFSATELLNPKKVKPDGASSNKKG